MKSLKLALVLVAFALVIGIVGSAALTTVSIDRSVVAGTVQADNASGAPVVFTAGTNFTTTATTDATSGVFSIDLGNALASGVTGFNAEAIFTVGASGNDVFTITNNSEKSLAVALDGATGGLILVGDATIAAGNVGHYYFRVDTTAVGVAKGDSIGGTLQVR